MIVGFFFISILKVVIQGTKKFLFLIVVWSGNGGMLGVELSLFLGESSLLNIHPNTSITTCKTRRWKYHWKCFVMKKKGKNLKKKKNKPGEDLSIETPNGDNSTPKIVCTDLCNIYNVLLINLILPKKPHSKLLSFYTHTYMYLITYFLYPCDFINVRVVLFWGHFFCYQKWKKSYIIAKIHIYV